MRCPTCFRRLGAGQVCLDHGSASSVATVAPAEPRRTRSSTQSPPIRLAPAWTEPLGDKLGTGGFADVWEIVSGGVLKVAHADHELSRARLAREAEALAAIGAPAVPAITGHGALADGRPWIAMERISGVTLGDLVTGEHVPLDEVIRIGGDALLAIARVHAAGFVHRDLKPDNIVRRSDGSIVLLDLGLARRFPTDPDDPTRAGTQVGSLEYIAPEQLADSAAVDPRADLYAFGCVLYELVSGRPPFVGDAATLERAHAALRPPPLASLVTVAAALDALVGDLLQKDRERRPSTAVVARSRLRAVRRDRAPNVEQTHSLSVIGAGQQPVVLVWVELPKVDRALLGRLAARKVVIVSQRGRRVLGALVGGEHGDPATAGIAAARDLAATGARVALHLDLARVVPGPTLQLAGDAVENPEAWLPSTAWTGVLLTHAFAAVVQAGARPCTIPGLEAFSLLAGIDDAVAIEPVGRDMLLSDLLAHAVATVDRRGPLADGGPGFAIVTGEPGTGKTVVARALAARLRRLGHVRTVLATIPPPGATPAAHSALAEVIALPAAPPGASLVRAIGDDLRAVARAAPLVLVIDDLHYADHDLLDAIEYATLGGESLPLWICAFASTRLDDRRPAMGVRAARHLRRPLGPLADDAAVQLTAKLLEPAQYPPLRSLRKLVAMARGNPLHLTMLAREIHERGAIGTRAGGERFLDTTALDALPPIALGPWLAARELAGASPELVALARLCAVLGGGGEVARAELVSVLALVERGGGASTTIDVDVGVKELVGIGLLVHTRKTAVRFRQSLLEEGLYATTAEPDRKAIHWAALAHWRGHRDATLAVDHIARHAEVIGERALAAEAYAAIGSRATAAHKLFEADQAWDRAVANLADGPPSARRGRALLGRARARERLLRIADMLADAEAAIGVATALGDAALEVAARIAQATALDWREDYAGAATAARIGRERLTAIASLEPGSSSNTVITGLEPGSSSNTVITGLEPGSSSNTVITGLEPGSSSNTVIAGLEPGSSSIVEIEPGALAALELDLDLADARALYRAQDIEHAIVAFEAVRARALALDIPEPRAIAEMMLGPALVMTDKLDRAPAVFAALIAHLEASGDRFHLGGAYVNRTWMWSKLGMPERSAADLRAAIAIAREDGQATTERNATHNYAEELLWQNAVAEAIPYAARGLALQKNFGEGPTQLDELLLARCLAAAVASGVATDEDRAQLAALVDGLATQALSDGDRVIVRALALVADPLRPRPGSEAWSAIFADLAALGETLIIETTLELAQLAMREGALEPRQVSALGAIAKSHPFFASRFETV